MIHTALSKEEWLARLERSHELPGRRKSAMPLHRSSAMS